jgi:hypothetical protein
MLYVRFFTDAPDPKNGFKANVGIGKFQLHLYCIDDNVHNGMVLLFPATFWITGLVMFG